LTDSTIKSRFSNRRQINLYQRRGVEELAKTIMPSST